MRDARLKGRAPQAHVNCWEDHLYHGHQRSKIVLHYQPSKPNIYPPIVVVHKFFGWRPPWMTLESISRSAIAMWQWECNQVNQQSGSTCKNKAHRCPSPFRKRSSTKEDISIESVGTEDQLADIFTKPLDEKSFCKLRNELNLLDFSNMCWCTPTYMTCLSFETPR